MSSKRNAKNSPASIDIPCSSKVPISINGRSLTLTCPHGARIEVVARLVGEEDALLTAEFSCIDDPYELRIVRDAESANSTPTQRSSYEVPNTGYKPQRRLKTRMQDGAGIPSAQAIPPRTNTEHSRNSGNDSPLDAVLVHDPDSADSLASDQAIAPVPAIPPLVPTVHAGENDIATLPEAVPVSDACELDSLASDTTSERTVDWESTSYESSLALSSCMDSRITYGQHGWVRVLRDDNRFHWEVNNPPERFDISSAFVRNLEFKPGDDPRIRAGIISLVPASEGAVDTKIKNVEGRDLVSYSDIVRAQIKTFEEKAQWFQDTCAQLCVEWNEGHVRMNIRRAFLLGDSVDAVMSLSRKDLRKLWRFEFIGEMGIDAGGLAREWFQLVTEEIFDPDMGLWQSSAVNQMSMQVNPASEFCCEDHLVYYRFLGRVMGKALFDRQLCSGHMVQYIYKHMLGWPVTFEDLKSVDEGCYNELKQLRDMEAAGEDLSMMCLDFTITTEVLGKKKEIELIPGGADVALDNDNFPEYLEAYLKYKLLNAVKPQITELLLGFFDVIPEPLLTIFDFEELQLLMCGQPEIDMDDWKTHTEYSGEYDGDPDHPACHWFWEVVTDFDHEMKARLLQFVTGTSGVPSRGFGVLQGNDGNIRKFTVHGVPVGVCLYPRAHTCFNRIDLPMYESKEELEKKLRLAVTMASKGFDIEY